MIQETRLAVFNRVLARCSLRFLHESAANDRLLISLALLSLLIHLHLSLRTLLTITWEAIWFTPARWAR